MKVLVTVLWLGILFVLTCSKSLADLLLHFSVGFHVVGHPEWSSLLIFNREDLHVPFYYVSKFGHFVGFGFLGLLLSWWSSKRKAISLALAYAIFTEVLQLYFGRDGRLVDAGIDFSGIMTFLLVKRLMSVDRKTYRKSADF